MDTIQRKASQFIVDFFAESKRALLITGARQIGKTYTIRQFGKTFDCFVEINFVEQPEAVEMFRNVRSVKELLLRISTLSRTELVCGKTLIFFDEVQCCPDIVTAIKFLVDEGSYRYALSGSLLGVELNDLRSEPVGYLGVYEMYPLDFYEFSSALGVPQNVWETVRDSFEKRQPIDDFIHLKLIEAFRLYMIIGGMPAVVATFLNSNNLQQVWQTQKDIITLYKRDIAQYDRKNKLQIDDIFDLIPAELNAKNKRFILKNLNENRKFKNMEDGFLWLKHAGVALPVFNVEEPKIPLLLSRSRNLFKLFQNDVGLLSCQISNGIQQRLLIGDTTINFGAPYENFVAQELHAHGFSLYYYNNKQRGEIDFMVEYRGNVLPIEVKSGKDYTRHNALDNILSCENYDFEEAFVLTNSNLKRDGKITYLPIYMVTLLMFNIPISETYTFSWNN